MRATCWARWATCALVLSICGPALAERGSRSLSTCTSFDQSETGDTKVSFTIRNSCTIPVDCALSWRLVCAPDSRKRRAVHPNQVKLLLSTGASQSTEASAASCGDDGWTIDSVLWSCQPNKD